jgi:hypothetical protein
MSVSTLVDITSNTSYTCTASFRMQMCRKYLRIKLNGFRPVHTLVDVTSNTFYKCTVTFRLQICKKCLRIKLNTFMPVYTLVDITSNTFYKCTVTFRTQCIITYKSLLKGLIYTFMFSNNSTPLPSGSNRGVVCHLSNATHTLQMRFLDKKGQPKKHVLSINHNHMEHQIRQQHGHQNTTSVRFGVGPRTRIFPDASCIAAVSVFRVNKIWGYRCSPCAARRRSLCPLSAHLLLLLLVVVVAFSP